MVLGHPDRVALVLERLDSETEEGCGRDLVEDITGGNLDIQCPGPNPRRILFGSLCDLDGDYF